MDTAVALYLIYRDVTYGGNDDDDSGSGGGDECILDSDCGLGYTCNPTTGDCELESVSGCNNNFVCEVSLGENTLNCDDCECGDGTCDSSEDFTICSLDCVEDLDCNNDGYCGFGENYRYFLTLINPTQTHIKTPTTPYNPQVHPPDHPGIRSPPHSLYHQDRGG